MASAPTIPLVPVEEYLSSSYEHDLEYVDGVLVERGMPTYTHGILQALLIVWFSRFQEQFGFATVPEFRMEIFEHRRYRVPDIMLVPPQSAGTRALRDTPFAVFEILSPDDGLSAQTRRCREYWERGVREIIVLDPEDYSAYRWVDKALVTGPITDGIRLPDGSVVPFSTEDLFAQLRGSVNRAAAPPNEPSE